MNTNKRFRIRLKKVHEESGKTAYRVSKDTGMSHNTISKYINEDEVIVGYLANTVMILADYYQVDWRDPKIIDIIEISEDDEGKEIKRPELLASTA